MCADLVEDFVNFFNTQKNVDIDENRATLLSATLLSATLLFATSLTGPVLWLLFREEKKRNIDKQERFSLAAAVRK